MNIENEKPEWEEIVLLETNIDHLTGEEIGLAINAISAMPEVLDACWLSGIGKKNRPMGLLRVLCRPEHSEAVLKAIFRHTHSLGVRRQKMDRLVLPRKIIPHAENDLPAKAYLLEGVEYLRPESDAVAELAASRGVGAPAIRLGNKD